MKAILITPESRSLDPIEITGPEDIAKLVGFDTIESDTVGKDGDPAELRDVVTDVEGLRARVEFL